MKYIFLSLLTILYLPLGAQSIAQKRAALSGAIGELDTEMQAFLTRVNEELVEKELQLRRLYSETNQLWERGAPQSSYQSLLQEINETKQHLKILQESWRQMATRTGKKELYALWDQPDTTVEQLVIDYGSLDFVYLVPQEIGEIPVNVSSSIPIPKSVWGQMVEQILLEKGIGIKTVNPFLRKLYFLRDDFSDLKLITASRNDLSITPDDYRIGFILSPEPADVQRTFFFLEKFVNPNSTSIQTVGRQILIVGNNAAVKETLKIYDFIDANRGGLEYRAIPIRKVDAQEMAAILESIFEQMTTPVSCSDKNQPFQAHSGHAENLGPKIIPLTNIAKALFIVGTREEIQKAEELVCQVENQVGEAHEKMIWTYKARHSDPEELASILQRIYLLMVQNHIGYGEQGYGRDSGNDNTNTVNANVLNDPDEINIISPPPRDLSQVYQDRFYQSGGYLINPRPIVPGFPFERETNVGRDNFIVDQKTASIVMVVEAELLPQLQEMICQLDVPKKMVQIEVLLFEKRTKRNTDYGLNLLKIGDQASQTRNSTVCWNDIGKKGDFMPENSGVLQLVFSRMQSSCFPAFDWIYKFMMTQDDISLNSSPSVVTVNQTPATIAIKDEISISTGIFEVPTDGGGVALKDSFTRAQYGITIVVTPSVHMHDELNLFDDPTDYITLQTDITFDTFIPGGTVNRPDVNRRNIVNEVRIPDGQTVILGGLRRKDTRDSKKTIPFLGEIPGIGKLFSLSSLRDTSTEMFIFITPKIISDPKEDFRQIREQELCKRPGDIPAFLCRLNEAQEREKNRLFKQWMTVLLGHEKPGYYCPAGEYDGR
ncbi:MAG: type II secretion system protein GspD [Waddliaceae bacterium]